MTNTRLITRAVLIALLAVAPAAEAGWLIVDQDGNQTMLSCGRLKVAPKQSEGASMVLDVARARMLVADSSRKVYWDGTVEEYCQSVQGMMAGLEKQLAEQLKDLPPAQREQMKEMMKQIIGSSPTASSTRSCGSRPTPRSCASWISAAPPTPSGGCSRARAAAPSASRRAASTARSSRRAGPCARSTTARASPPRACW
jgi:hypothetical protein